MYAILIDTFIKDSVEKGFLFNGLENIPCLKKKSEWVHKYMNKEQSFATRLIAFCCIEGI
jgi:ribonucleoside-diphosphate reductase subunit M2